MLGRTPSGSALLVVALLISAPLGATACFDGPEGARFGGGYRADGHEATSGQKIETATGLPCDVSEVLRDKCQTCHSSNPQFGANTALVTWDDLQKPAPGTKGKKKVLDLVMDRIHDDARPMPPSPKPRLDAIETSALDMWISGGAQSTDTRCIGERAPEAVKGLSCTPDTVLKAKKPYTMPANAPLDQYVCYGVEYELETKRHIVGFGPKVDNAKIVHHILLFQTDQAVSSDPFVCPAAGLAPWRLVAGWNPGGNNLELPPEAGFPAEAGTTHWVVQVHYNNAAQASATDNSGYELCTTENLRKNDAGIAAFGSVAFTIPPRAEHTIRCDVALGAEWNGTRFFNASPHMHTLGTAMSGERLPKGGGAPERFFEEKKFSFDAQGNYPVSIGVGGGDVIRTRCTWKNTTDGLVGFGESSQSEMCFDFVGYYPRIATMPWLTPSVATSCVAE